MVLHGLLANNRGHMKYLVGSVSPGTEQLIGDIANKSEMRQYKLKQRLKG